MLQIGTVCSGIGAPEKALTNLGIDYKLNYFCEIDKYAAKSYCAIHGVSDSLNRHDLTAYGGGYNLPCGLDLLVGGTPCQDFSYIGLGLGGDENSGTRSSLMWYFVKIIKDTAPQTVLWENVPGILSKKHIGNYNKLCDVLRQLGYEVYSKRLNARAFGVPQDRERVFVLATKTKQRFTFPQGYDCGVRIKDVLEPVVADKYFLSQKTLAYYEQHTQVQLQKGNGFAFKPLTDNDIARTVSTHGGDRITDNYIIINRGHGYVKDSIKTDGIFPTVRQANTQCGNTVICEPIIFDDYNGRVRADQTCIGTITTNTGSSGIGNGTKIITQDRRIRRPTPIESFRLMGFTDADCKKCYAAGISDTQLYKQAGNSIVVNVLMALFGEFYGVEWKTKVYGERYNAEQELWADLPLLRFANGG